MRKLALLVLAFTALASAQSGKLTPQERTFLIDQMTKTKAEFLESLKGISAAQWTFKASPTSWSVAECAEHIVLSEDLLFGISQKTLQKPAQDRPANSTAEGDRNLVTKILDRSQKAKAPEPLVPTGKWPTPEAAIAEFNSRRDRNLKYARTTEDELRVHADSSQLFGTIDAYQYLLLMAAHSGRHTAQIREVQADSGYPRGK
jgi:hypothetical protein